MLAARISRHVARYTGHAGPARVIRDGREARKAGGEDTAATRPRRAVTLARESGNEDTADLAASVAGVIDPATETIRLKAKMAGAEEMTPGSRPGSRPAKTIRARK